MKLTLKDETGISDTKDVRFGVREISYELSLLDKTGHLRRVEFSPTAARGGAGPVVDVSHQGMREIPSADAAALNLSEEEGGRYSSHVASIVAGAENSPALQTLSDMGPAPYLVIKVTRPYRCAWRTMGAWYSLMRVTRARLEPYFRLNRDAKSDTTIRNLGPARYRRDLLRSGRRVRNACLE